jgi:Holliday junction resolvase RusA-like endonuclease
MPVVTVVDLVVAQSDNMQSLSFTALGAPLVQQRTKITWRGRRFPHVYDPCALSKEEWQGHLHRALVDCGVSVFPFFSEATTENMQSDGLQIDVVFHMMRVRSDYRVCKGKLVLLDNHQKYPGTKDVDNMVKYIMDVFHDVLYENDNCVVKIIASKKFVKEDEKTRGAYTTISVSTI